MLYTVTVWTYEGGGSYRPYVRFQVGTRRAAELAANKSLESHAITTTWELRSHAHASFASVEDRDGNRVATYEAPVEYVDSIATRLRRGEAVAV